MEGTNEKHEVPGCRDGAAVTGTGQGEVSGEELGWGSGRCQRVVGRMGHSWVGPLALPSPSFVSWGQSLPHV